MTAKPFELWFKPDDEFTPQTLLGRYETRHLADRCAGLVRACITEGSVEVEFNVDAIGAS